MKLDICGEPFNYSIKQINKYPFVKDGELIIPDNIVLKNIIRQQPKEFFNVPHLEFCENLISHFDKVIMITRQRQDLLLESYMQAVESGFWHSKWCKTHDFQNTEAYKIEMEENLDMLLTIALKYRTPLTIYEELYSGDKTKIDNIIKLWDIPGLTFENMFKYINPEKRYRQPDNIKKTLI